MNGVRVHVTGLRFVANDRQFDFGRGVIGKGYGPLVDELFSPSSWKHREAFSFALAPTAGNVRTMYRNADRLTGILLLRRFLAQRLNAQLTQ